MNLAPFVAISVIASSLVPDLNELGILQNVFLSLPGMDGLQG